MIQCGECRETWESKWRYPPPCDSCACPGVWLENLGAWRVFAEAGPALFDGSGGINLENAKIVCETLGMEWDLSMMRKIMAAASAFLEERGRHQGP